MRVFSEGRPLHQLYSTYLLSREWANGRMRTNTKTTSHEVCVTTFKYIYLRVRYFQYVLRFVRTHSLFMEYDFSTDTHERTSPYHTTTQPHNHYATCFTFSLHFFSRIRIPYLYFWLRCLPVFLNIIALILNIFKCPSFCL